MQEEQIGRPVDRRRLLRRAGTVAVGVAGAGVASAVVASPAQAATGAMQYGANNDAGTDQTGLITNKADGAALHLTNAGGAPLTLDPASPLTQTAPVGSVFVDTYGDVQTIGSTAEVGKYVNWLYSPTWAKMPEPLLVPARAVDTRSSGGRTRILNPSALDSLGRLRGGQTMHVDLSDLADLADAVLGTIAALSATGSGYLTVYPWGQPKPATANVGYGVGKDTNSFVFTGAGFDDADLDPSTAISVYAHATTHVIFDVFGFVVRVPEQVLANAGIAGATANATELQDTRRDALMRRLPTLRQR